MLARRRGGFGEKGRKRRTSTDFRPKKGENLSYGGKRQEKERHDSLKEKGREKSVSTEKKGTGGQKFF